ncbi:MAG: sporulation protein [Bacteroidota bacterium]
MFGKVKRWLGIEGVKLELLLPEEISESSQNISGAIRFFSMNEQVVTRISVVLIERYTRGRNNEKMTDEYVLGRIELEDRITIPADEAIEVEFELPFNLSKSEMDELEDKNILYKGFVKAAKWFNSVNSEYRVEAEAAVVGTALPPFDRKEVQFS